MTLVRRTTVLSNLADRARNGPAGGAWLFIVVVAAQVGHLIEHITKALIGSPLLGAAADTELTHFLFNCMIALLAVALVAVYPRNPWVYPLLAIALVHGAEHVYIFDHFVRTGASNGPGLFGLGGALGLIPVERFELHNVYNGIEMILMVLGLGNEIELQLTETEG